MSLSRRALLPSLCAGVASALLVAAAPAAAQTPPFTFSGFGTGCFWSTGPACPDFQDIDNLGGLRFNGNSFTRTPNVLGVIPNVNLGILTFLNEPTTFGTVNNDRFRLNVTFTQPGSTEAILRAIITGQVVSNTTGAVALDFGGAQVIPFATADGTGTFRFTVQDMAITRPGGVPNDNRVTGRISDIQFTPFIVTPEPATFGLVSAGILALGAVGYRRRRQAARD